MHKISYNLQKIILAILMAPTVEGKETRECGFHSVFHNPEGQIWEPLVRSIKYLS